ncbi:uncharacterized protein BROUX77_002559 [Berkeleyomyces rouxiae]|uniref:uncharacterized protein n=1 Tax=Berkeleyomyces rouxiae TaxID=2035830 RepID=UPI003B7DAA28
MKDPKIQEATASEPMTLDEELENQKSWRTSTDKLTFILCKPLDFSSSSSSLPSVVSGTTDADDNMLGDINLFLTEVVLSDSDDEGATVPGSGSCCTGGGSGCHSHNVPDEERLYTGEIDVMIATPDQQESVEAATPVAIFKKRGPKGKNLRKRPATPPPAHDLDSDSGFESTDDENTGQRIKRRKKATHAVITASSATTGPEAKGVAEPATADLNATVFAADRSVAITSVNDATKQSNWFDEPGEGTSVVKKSNSASGPAAQSSIASSSTSAPDGTYKGLANQAKFIEKNPNAPNRTYGPMKAATNIRTITVTDYAPDVCKDYKQTGFCGFGDNCKFLHSREQVMQGWQLDRAWENVSKGKKNMGGTVIANAAERTAQVNGGASDEKDAAEAALLGKIPFKCIICKDDYKAPIITRCGHHFCEACALKRYRKDPSCAACGVGTNGVFNGAKKLSKLLEKKAARQEQMKAQDEEAET